MLMELWRNSNTQRFFSHFTLAVGLLQTLTEDRWIIIIQIRKGMGMGSRAMVLKTPVLQAG